MRVEITTFRAEVYRPESRKPEVTFSDSLETDLSRRDFTVNAMAISLPEPQLIDPYGGLDDLLIHKRLRTPLEPGGLVPRRPAPDDAGGPVHGRARPRARPGAGRRRPPTWPAGSRW